MTPAQHKKTISLCLYGLISKHMQESNPKAFKSNIKCRTIIRRGVLSLLQTMRSIQELLYKSPLATHVLVRVPDCINGSQKHILWIHSGWELQQNIHHIFRIKKLTQKEIKGRHHLTNNHLLLSAIHDCTAPMLEPWTHEPLIVENKLVQTKRFQRDSPLLTSGFKTNEILCILNFHCESCVDVRCQDWLWNVLRHKSAMSFNKTMYRIWRYQQNNPYANIICPSAYTQFHVETK